jgi:hypothetical protein
LPAPFFDGERVPLTNKQQAITSNKWVTPVTTPLPRADIFLKTGGEGKFQVMPDKSSFNDGIVLVSH